MERFDYFVGLASWCRKIKELPNTVEFKKNRFSKSTNRLLYLRLAGIYNAIFKTFFCET